MKDKQTGPGKIILVSWALKINHSVKLKKTGNY